MSDNQIDEKRRKFLTTVTSVVGAAGAGLAATPFVKSMEPDASVQAASTTTVDIGAIGPGEQVTVKWQDKPVFIVNRTPEMLATLKKVTPELLDPDNKLPQQPPYCNNMYRSRKPEWFVMVGVCTHLCCTPTFKPQQGSVNPKWLGGYHCPCHGSFYDLSGRVFKDVPAPRNMAIPEYEFTDNDTKIKITSLYPKSKLC
ncbi:MAG TPA: ubiquinol-cytochrome c reductase iron-sulfur subunit [Gammaproteobacteria bacterium]|nr:ubiquinol-cytochrome c reductase iron-sulfur subunit [Gammaproteobacteria bacterium]